MAKHDIWLRGLEYAKRGWATFPLKPESKEPAINKWQLRATTDPERLERWSNDLPDANLGILPGRSNLVVIDIDPKNGGKESFRKMIAEVGFDCFEGARTVQTPSGGQHIYFTKPDAVFIGTYRPIVPGIDLFGKSGYVVAPPSRLSSSGYTWIGDVDEEPAVLPGTIIRWIAAHEKLALGHSQAKTRAAYQYIQDNRQVLEGKRTMTLVSLAGKLRSLGLGANEIASTLKIVNAERCKPPLTERELGSIVQSASEWQPGFADFEFKTAWLDVLPPNELRLAWFLLDLADAQGKCSVAVSTIESGTGMDQSAISRAAIGLESRGALKRKIRGPHLATVYTLQIPTVIGRPA